jgi:membrane-associated phospholipid phosphatase
MNFSQIKQKIKQKLTFFDQLRIGLSLIISIPLIWLFLNIPKTIIREEAGFAFEQNFWFWLRANIPPWLGGFVSFIYDIGDKEVSAFVVAGSLGFLLWKKLWKDSLLLAIASGGVLILVDKIFKPVVGRVRPPYFTAPYGTVPDITGLSFPSGHATGNCALYLVLSTLLVRKYPQYKILIYSLTFLFIIAMGLGSLYLGVHWPSDIIGGYGLGFIWFTICITVIELFFPSKKKLS